MSSRPTTSTLIEARADCERCNWSVVGANAQGLAAQHYDKKLHKVRVRTTNEIVYGRLSGAVKGEPQGSLKL